MSTEGTELPVEETAPEETPIEAAAAPVVVDHTLANLEHVNFLMNTDWIVTRHRDQLDLGVPTSLSQEEYLELLQQRQTARESIITSQA